MYIQMQSIFFVLFFSFHTKNEKKKTVDISFIWYTVIFTRVTFEVYSEKKTLNFSLVSGNIISSFKLSFGKKKKTGIHIILNVLEYIVGIVSGCKVYGCHLYTHNTHFNNLIHHHTQSHTNIVIRVYTGTQENRRKIIIFIHRQVGRRRWEGSRETQILQPFGWSGPGLTNPVV